MAAPASRNGKSILATEAVGFIGTNFVFEWFGLDPFAVVSRDNLTYAGNLDNLASMANDPRHVFVHGDQYLQVRPWQSWCL